VADVRLTDAELSQGTTAARLHVSLRALRRAFAGLRGPSRGFARLQPPQAAAGAPATGRTRPA
jgi:hypothetical protein